MNTFEVKYHGNLRSQVIHIDSKSKISIDAPKDNHGMGEFFSPTDLLCCSLATCIMTIMAISVKKNNIDLINTTAIIKKTMAKNPRRIKKIQISFNFPKDYDNKTKNILERAAKNCPVHHSLSTDIQKDIYFNYQ